MFRPEERLSMSGRITATSRKRWALSGGMAPEKRRRRLVGWLQRRGHAMSLIQRIMDSLEAEDERAKYE